MSNNSFLRVLGLAILLLAIGACNKTSTVTVTVKQQMTGAQVVVSDSVLVVMVNTANANSIVGATSSAQGVAVFDNMAKGNYKVSSEVWGGAGYLTDSSTIQVKDGKSVTVNLLLQ